MITLAGIAFTVLVSSAALPPSVCPAIDAPNDPAQAEFTLPSDPATDASPMDDYDPSACLAQQCPWVNCSSASGCWSAYLHDVCYCPLEPDRELRRQCRVDAERALTDCTKSSGK
jgi:hypothetical protein